MIFYECRCGFLADVIDPDVDYCPQCGRANFWQEHNNDMDVERLREMNKAWERHWKAEREHDELNDYNG